MNKKWSLFSLGILCVALVSCAKSFNSDPPGGLLPTNYVTVTDSSFSPTSLTVATGSSITFLNQTAIVHTLVGDDSTFFPASSIDPDRSLFFRPDTSSPTSSNIIISYHCIEHPSARGTIVLTP